MMHKAIMIALERTRVEARQIAKQRALPQTDNVEHAFIAELNTIAYD